MLLFCRGYLEAAVRRRGRRDNSWRQTYTLRRFFIVPTAALFFAFLAQQSSAQSLTFSLSLFERYLESLRVEAGIPGLSALVLQNGVPVWRQGFGRQDVEASIPATPDTPYVIGDVSQTLGATLLLKKCVE